MTAWLVCAWALLAGCAKHTAMEQAGGETNWLMACTSDAQCEEGACLCGVCTSECDVSSGCLREDRACIASTSPVGYAACEGASSAPRALCLPECGSDAPCGDGWACRDAVCVLEVVAERLDDAVDVSVDAGDEPRMPLGNEPQGNDAEILTCECGKELTSLACVCWEIGELTGASTCPSPLEELFPACNAAPGVDLKMTGCGRTVTRRELGTDTLMLVHDGNRLVGASYERAEPFGLCETTRYRTPVPDLSSCEDYTVCALCGGDGVPYPTCAQ